MGLQLGRSRFFILNAGSAVGSDLQWLKKIKTQCRIGAKIKQRVSKKTSKQKVAKRPNIQKLDKSEQKLVKTKWVHKLSKSVQKACNSALSFPRFRVASSNGQFGMTYWQQSSYDPFLVSFLVFASDFQLLIDWTVRDLQKSM